MAVRNAKLAGANPQRQVTIVPGCAHDVCWVFPHQAAQSALFDTSP
jgi:hypothetical protein